ncbi:MAG: hypothetical protein JRC86_05835 [Deltaproteobacteria bacterium]|nr:hypothetical protein [Deltaproteobacteria bacterium]
MDFTKKGTLGLVRAPKNRGGMVRQYIPGRIQDNPILMDTNPNYINQLDALPEPFRTAYKDGDWELFVGQAFEFNRIDHVCKYFKPPENVPIYMTFDWGYGAPFSIHWSWIDSDNRVWVFKEWYGCESTGLDDDITTKGLRITDYEIAQGIINREEQWGLQRDLIQRMAGHDCWNKKPDYKGGGQGPSTAEVFSACGLYMNKADSDRQNKIRAFRERLRIPEEKEDKPMLMVYEECKHLIRTIPLLQMDPINVEDIDTNMEDHCYDDICHICMARPLSPELIMKRKSSTDKRIDTLTRGNIGSFERDALYDTETAHNHIIKEATHFDDWDDQPFEDQGLRSTIQ